MEQQRIISGYVLVSGGHPDVILSDTFTVSKKACIVNLEKKTGLSWTYWQEEKGYKRVPATQTVSI
jgi:hypothetical protein